MGTSSTTITLSVRGVDDTARMFASVKANAVSCADAASKAVALVDAQLGGAIGKAKSLASSFKSLGLSATSAFAGGLAVQGAMLAYGAIKRRLEEIRQAELDVMRVQAESAKALMGRYDAILKSVSDRLAFEEKIAGIRGDISALRRRSNTAVDEYNFLREHPDGEYMDPGRRADIAYREASAKTKAVFESLGREEEALRTRLDILARKESAALLERNRAIDDKHAFYRDKDKVKIAQDRIDAAQKEIESIAAERKAVAQMRQVLQARREAAREQLALASMEHKIAQVRVAEQKRRKAEDEAYGRARGVGEAYLNLVDAEEKAIKGLREMAARRDQEIRSAAQASLARSVSQTTGGARATSLEDVARVSALLAAGIVQRSATGYMTSQGDAMRQAEKDRKTEQYQQKMLQLVEDVARNAKVGSAELAVNVMDF